MVTGIVTYLEGAAAELPGVMKQQQYDKLHLDLLV